jgi:hypothetical protein
MGKLDKKALKVLKTRQFVDLDAGDIAIALRCEDDIAQESLNSLKDQKIIESYSLGGKTFWRLFSDESYEKSAHSEPAKKREIFNKSGAEEFYFNMKTPDYMGGKNMVKTGKGSNDVDALIKSEDLEKSESEEFSIDLLPKEPMESKKHSIEFEPVEKSEDLEKSESEEFSIDLLPPEPMEWKKHSIEFEPAKKREDLKKSEMEEFYIDLLRKDPIEPIKQAIGSAPSKREVLDNSKPEEFNVDMVPSKDKSETIDDQSLIDDSTRSWTPPELIFNQEKTDKEEVFNDNEQVDDTNNAIPLKSNKSSKMGIMIAIVVSVAISTGIALLIAMNINKNTISSFQTLESAITETNAKQDQRIDGLNKKLNVILEKTDLLQKLKASGNKNRPVNRPKEK